QCRMALLHGLLDILRVVVGAADDDDILDAAGDEQLAARVDKTEIAGPQPRAVFLPDDPRPERCLALVRIAPIALRDIGAGHPDLADAAVRKPLSALGVDDRDFLAGERAAAADDGLIIGGFAWRHGRVTQKTGAAHRTNEGPLA